MLAVLRAAPRQFYGGGGGNMVLWGGEGNMVYLFIRFFSKAWTRSDRCGCLAYTILQTRSCAAGFQRTFTQVWGGNSTHVHR